MLAEGKINARPTSTCSSLTDDVDEAVALMVAAREDAPADPDGRSDPMMWFFAILIVLAMGGVAVVAAGRGAPLAAAYDDRPDVARARDRPARGATTCARVRFSLAFRGYRMSEVDALLDRLATELEDARRAGPRPDELAGDGAAA